MSHAQACNHQLKEKAKKVLSLGTQGRDVQFTRTPKTMKKHGGRHGALGMISHLGQVAQLEAAPGMETHGHPEDTGRPMIPGGSEEGNEHQANHFAMALSKSCGMYL